MRCSLATSSVALLVLSACAPAARVSAPLPPAPSPGLPGLDSAAMQPGRFDAGKM